MTNLFRRIFKAHPFHLVSPSPWLILTCASLLAFTTSSVLTMHGFPLSLYFFYMALILLVSSMSLWFKNMISEATYKSNHTLAVQKGLNMGIALFIISEALFFSAIFWTFMRNTLSTVWALLLNSPPKPYVFVSPPSGGIVGNTIFTISTTTFFGSIFLGWLFFGAVYTSLFDQIGGVIAPGLPGRPIDHIARIPYLLHIINAHNAFSSLWLGHGYVVELSVETAGNNLQMITQYIFPISQDFIRMYPALSNDITELINLINEYNSLIRGVFLDDISQRYELLGSIVTRLESIMTHLAPQGVTFTFPDLIGTNIDYTLPIYYEYYLRFFNPVN